MSLEKSAPRTAPSSTAMAAPWALMYSVGLCKQEQPRG